MSSFDQALTFTFWGHAKKSVNDVTDDDAPEFL